MIIEFLLATTLNMSLSEFQPMVDISGNVIVSSIDDETKEIMAEEIPLDDISISYNESDPVDQGLSLEQDRTEVEFEIENSPMLRSIEVHTVESSVLTNMRIRDGALQSHSGDNLNYIYLTAGIEYTLYNLSSIQISNSLSRGATVTQYDLTSTYTPSENCYILRNNTSFYVTYTSGTPDDEPGGDVSGDDVSGDDVSGGDVSGDEPGNDVSGDEPGGNISTDLSNVELKLDNVITLQRAILMTLLITFLFPIIKSCANLLKGGKDV